MWTPEQKATAGFKMMIAEGIEFTSKTGRPSLLVAFRSPEISHKVRDQLLADGFTVTVCPNQSWLEVK